jgi:hypothetical protein
MGWLRERIKGQRFVQKLKEPNAKLGNFNKRRDMQVKCADFDCVSACRTLCPVKWLVRREWQ